MFWHPAISIHWHSKWQRAAAGGHVERGIFTARVQKANTACNVFKGARKVILVFRPTSTVLLVKLSGYQACLLSIRH